MIVQIILQDTEIGFFILRSKIIQFSGRVYLIFKDALSYFFLVIFTERSPPPARVADLPDVVILHVHVPGHGRREELAVVDEPGPAVPSPSFF